MSLRRLTLTIHGRLYRAEPLPAVVGLGWVVVLPPIPAAAIHLSGPKFPLQFVEVARPDADA